MHKTAFFVVFATCFLILGCSTKQILPDWMKLSQSQTDIKRYAEAGWETSHEAAVEKSRATGKPILMWFTGSDWCSWCIKLDREVFQTDEFKKWSDNNVVLLMLDFPRSTTLPTDIRIQNEKLQEQYARQINGFPTTIFVDPDGRAFGKVGYVRGGPEKWIAAAAQQLGNVQSAGAP